MQAAPFIHRKIPSPYHNALPLPSMDRRELISIIDNSRKKAYIFQCFQYCRFHLTVNVNMLHVASIYYWHTGDKNVLILPNKHNTEWWPWDSRELFQYKDCAPRGDRETVLSKFWVFLYWQDSFVILKRARAFPRENTGTRIHSNHWLIYPLDKMAAFSQMIFSYASSWMKSIPCLISLDLIDL